MWCGFLSLRSDLYATRRLSLWLFLRQSHSPLAMTVKPWIALIQLCYRNDSCSRHFDQLLSRTLGILFRIRFHYHMPERCLLSYGTSVLGISFSTKWLVWAIRDFSKPFSTSVHFVFICIPQTRIDTGLLFGAHHVSWGPPDYFGISEVVDGFRFEKLVPRVYCRSFM